MTDRVLIVGGGIGGLVAALCFAEQGFEVEVFERAAELSEIGAGIQLSPNATHVLHGLGLEQSLRSVAFLPAATEFRGWKKGEVISQNALGESALSRYGAPYYHIHRADLIEVLLLAVEAAPLIRLHTNAEVFDFSQTDAGVRLRTASAEYEGALLVGADGIHSVVRATLFGKQSPRFTGNVAWRGLVPTELLPKDLIRPVSTAWWGPGKHFVHYYVRRGELVNCVCVVEKSGWEVESWNERGDHGELKADFAGWHDSIQMLIDAMDPAACYKWALFDRPPMERWSDGRVTLLGDACHPTLPFMAQGAAMAIEDGAVLVRCIADSSDIASSLARYETLRIARTAAVQKGSRRNASVFHMSGIKAWVRNRAAQRAGSRAVDGLYSYNPLDGLGALGSE